MKNKKHYVIVGTTLFLLSIPILGILLYSVSSLWEASILPEGLSIKWYKQLLGDVRFLVALKRSFLLSIIALGITITILIPSIVISAYYFPRILKLIELISLFPFMIPEVVLAVGLMKVYSGVNFTIFGIPPVIIGAYFAVGFPFIYRGVKNSLDALPLQSLVETVDILGGTKFDAFRYVILPNLKKGITSSSILTLAIFLGEFTFTNLLIGGRYETLQVYLYNMKGKSGHFTSAMVSLFFVFIFIVTLLTTNLDKIFKKKRGRK